MSPHLFSISLKTPSIVLQKEIYSQSFRQYKKNRANNLSLFSAFYQSGQEYYGQVHPSLLSGTLNEDKYARVSMSELNVGTFIGLNKLKAACWSLCPHEHITCRGNGL
ncbi:hypothetical protein CDAR_610881 [Caerostris darwini]|uniref:Uncharacterized protein n=1 Tax=Caerostris darwini TaxID=1538125 RepID=A0AAV4WYA8_9ARAC|nr:hypothetical protein CDAR_610881 [Caerostris darwini]